MIQKIEKEKMIKIFATMFETLNLLRIPDREGTWRNFWI